LKMIAKYLGVATLAMYHRRKFEEEINMKKF